MRVIAGSAKGRRLRAPDTRGTRPATDRVREAVFSSIGAFVEGADVADLYAGSGSLGLEALSRGAGSAVFVESGRKALAALNHNLAATGLGPARVKAADVAGWLPTEARGGPGFDLVFMDPPWDQPSSTMTEQLSLVDELLRPGGEVVVSRRHTDPDPEPPKTWRVAANKRYGDTRIIRYEKVKTDDDSDVPGEFRSAD